MALSDALRHHVTIALLDEFGLNQVASVTRSLPQVATQKLTISYGPASDADRAVLESLAGQQATSIPAYLLRLIPEIRIDEAIVATGPSVGMGKDQAILVTLEGPNQPSDQLRHDRIAGDYSLVGLELGNTSGRKLTGTRGKLLQTKARIEQQPSVGAMKEEVIGEILHAISLAYWADLNFYVRVSGDLHRMVPLRLPSEGLNTSAARITYVFDAPLTAEPGGVTLDVQHNLLTSFSSLGSHTAEHAYNLMLGMVGSLLEGSILEQFFRQSGKAASAVYLLRLASIQGIPVHEITSTNAGAVLPLLTLSDDTKIDIQNAVAAGKTVYVSAHEITLNGWTGTGYIVVDPATGAGAFQISGGLAGAFLADLLWGSLFLFGLGWSLSIPLGVAFEDLLVNLRIASSVTAIGYFLDGLRQGRFPPDAPSTKAILLSITNIVVQATLFLGLAALVLPYLLVPLAAVPGIVIAVSVGLLLFMMALDFFINLLVVAVLPNGRQALHATVALRDVRCKGGWICGRA